MGQYAQMTGVDGQTVDVKFIGYLAAAAATVAGEQALNRPVIRLSYRQVLDVWNILMERYVKVQQYPIEKWKFNLINHWLNTARKTDYLEFK